MSAARGLFELSSGPHKDLVERSEGLLDSVAAAMIKGHAQSRFYCCALLGELCFFNEKNSEKIAGHQGIRSGVLDVLRCVNVCVCNMCMYVCVLACLMCLGV